MKILALDTSHSACSIALLTDAGMHCTHHVAPMQQAQVVLPLIEALLTAHAVKIQDLDALAFGRGPGSFTGVRIAASVMQGLAFATRLPLIGVSSLAATAQAAFDDLGWRKLLVGTDARIQEVYWGAYTVNASGLVELIGTEVVTSPHTITPPAGQDWYAVGNAWLEYQPAMLARLGFVPVAMDTARMPMASAVARLAETKFAKREWSHSSEDSVPVYLRDNVAIKGK